MTTIDGNWITSRLKGYRGEKAELARASGLKPKQISEILSGTRAVRQDEADAIRAFFGTPAPSTPNPQYTNGFAEAGAEPYSLKDDGHANTLLAAIAPEAIHPATYRATSAAPDLSILAGDLLVIDTKSHPKDGDTVVATIPADNDYRTVIRRLYSPWLIPSNPNTPPINIEDTPDCGIYGPVKACLRQF